MLAPMQSQGLYGALGLGLDIQPENSWGGRSSLLGMFVGYSAMVAAGRVVVRSSDAPFDEAMRQVWQNLNPKKKASGG